jgi:methyl halide transferase
VLDEISRFFVAIPPSRRDEWGHQMSALVKPGGFLITLVYPLNPFREDGPPYYIQPEHYIEALGQNWEKVIERVPEESIPSHIGLEYLMVWKNLRKM